MSSRRIKRIFNEIKELEDSKKILIDSGIYFGYDEDNLDKIHVMFVGPKDTPYEKGFYFFELTYPENYPMTPPNMKYFTQGYLYNKKKQNIKIRFNPNLYTNGKVCLSMLNTWKGPGWVPTNTISNILVAIQALVFNEEPLRNEPGFENSPKVDIDYYNKILEFSNFKIAICDQLNSDLGVFQCFKSIMIDYIKENKDYYENKFEEMKEKENEEIASQAYGLHTILNYKSLVNYYETVKTKTNI
jgi:ubiquitin-protein ligase